VNIEAFMKKSEFIQKVLEENGEYTKIEVEQLLETFQKLGMLPPVCLEKSKLPGIDDFVVNKWEPEEEG
jgi:hypothetical protein